MDQPQRLPASDPDLREELLAMAAADQNLRQAMAAKYADGAPMSPADETLAQTLDDANTARLKELVAEHGWPTVALAGIDGAEAAWLLAQHADRDPAFQKHCLALLIVAAAAGEASQVNVAYLEDRVRLHESRPQLYGTQLRLVDGRFETGELEDEANVDALRAAAGLGPLSEYVADMERRYGRNW